MAARDVRRSRIGSGVRVALGCGLGAVLLVGCTGAPTAGTGSPSALPVASPTPAGTGEESPLPRSDAGPALRVVAAGSGFVASYPDTPGVVCLNFAWESPEGGPALGDGLAFVAQGVHVDPPSWVPSPTGCPGDRVPCLGSPISDAQPLCQVALVRRDGPTATGRTGSRASLVGTVTCTVPATDAECAAVREALAAQDGTALPLDDAIVQQPPPNAPTPAVPVPTTTSAPTPAPPLQGHVPQPTVTVRAEGTR